MNDVAIKVIVISTIMVIIGNLLIISAIRTNKPKRVRHAKQNKPSYRSLPNSMPAPLPTASVNHDHYYSYSHSADDPPPLPTRKTNMSHRDIYSFPRCPVCRSSNRPGSAQKIFLDYNTHRWKCIEGHNFKS